MEEINRMKEMITSNFETNGKMAQILQEWEADNNAAEEQCRRIHDLNDSFQRLSNRIQEGDDEFHELECMVSDLGARIEQASSLVWNCTRVLKEERDRCQSTDLGTTKCRRSAGLQHIDGGSELPLQRDKNKTKTHNVSPGHNDEHSRLSVANSTYHNTEKHKHKKKVRFAGYSVRSQVVNSVDSQESSMSKKVGWLTENEKADAKYWSIDFDYSDDKYPAAKVPVNDTGFKQRLTEKRDDNRIHYFRKVEMKIRKNKRTVKEHQGVNATTRQCKAPLWSAGGDGSVDRTYRGTGIEEALNLAGENPNIIQQFTQQAEHESFVKDDMDMAEYGRELAIYGSDIARRAVIEKQEGEAGTLPRGVGPDTVLCLDTSESMEGAAFQQMISLAIKFVDGIRQSSQILGIEENIGVVTFGKEPGVPLHLTNQYDKVKEVLLSLKAEGPSPILEGIAMALAACGVNGRRFTVRRIPVGSRIILISDGKGTPDHWHLRGDTVDPNNAEAKILVNKNMVIAGNLVKSSGNTVYSVPVGEYTEGTLEQVAILSGGNIIRTNEFSRLVQFARLQRTAANRIFDCRGLDEGVDHEPFLRAIIGVESTSPGEPNFDQRKMDVLTLALKYTKHPVPRMDHSRKKGDVMKEVNTYMPCIATRVRRGPTWHFGNQDHGGPGTVVGHDSDRKVWVEWDIGGNRNVYSYVRGIHDVTVVEEERELAVDEDVGVGCKVKRGKDWTYGDQDGGDETVGVVCWINHSWIDQKFVHVRWPNKTLKRYRFGADGRFDVEVINQRKRSITCASILPPRKRSIADKPKEGRKEMSLDDINRFNQRK